MIRGSRSTAQYAVRLNSESASNKDAQFTAVAEVSLVSLVSTKYGLMLFRVEPIAKGRENTPGLLDAVAASVPKESPLILGELTPKFLEESIKRAGKSVNGNVAFARFIQYVQGSGQDKAEYYVCFADMKKREISLYTAVVTPIGKSRVLIASLTKVDDPKFKYTSVGVVRRAVDAALA